MQYCIVKNNAITETATNFESLFPTTIFPSNYLKVQEFLEQNNCYSIRTYKEHNPAIEKLIECEPYIENNRVYSVRTAPLSTLELKTMQENTKQEKVLKTRLICSEQVNTLKVETSYGHIFDADELSQSRIQKALYLLNLENKDSIEWILADNSKAEIFKPELEEALTLAIKKQAEIWVKSWTDKNEANLS